MFRKSLLVLFALGSLALWAGAAHAQVVVYRPFLTTPAVTYSPVVTTYGPVIAPAPAVVYRPPFVAYSPVVTTYSPVAPAYAPVVAARPVLIRTKVYVAGQPVRNFFRAITP